MRINEEAARKLSVVDQMTESISHLLVHADRLRQSVLTSAFTGQLVPQDPTDEPASALLERIRAGRVESSKKTAARNVARKRGKQ
jgi:type I restriction enzyme S subunit